MWKGAAATVATIAMLGAGSVKAGDTTQFQKDFDVGPLKISVQGKTGVEVHTTMSEGDYWLGVVCSPVPEAIRSQLGLGEHEGLLVHHVAPESPAGKAGIRRDDVLVKVNSTTLATSEDLIQAIGAAKDKKVALALVRQGKKMTVSVQPEKRPEHVMGKTETPWGEPADWQGLQGWLEHVLPNEGGPIRFHVLGPGVILPSGTPLYPNLPDNMTVVITKHGQEPAQIAVHEGDKKWEVTEKELDKLPKDVRPYVDQMFGAAWRGAFGAKAAAGFGGAWNAGPGPAPVLPETRLQKRLDDMSRQIEEMQKSVEQLRQKDSQPKKPQPDKAKGQPALRSDRT